MILYALPDADSSKSLSRSRPKRILLQVLLHLSTLPQPYDTSKTTYDPLTTYLRSAYDSSRRFTTLRALLQPLIDETPQLSVLLLQRSPLIPGCPLPEVLPRDPVPFFTNGNLNFKAHDVGWIVAGLFSIIATWASIWLIMKHLSFFYHPSEQRMIVRILFMPIIYGWCSFMSYYFVHDALYWQLARDCYEAIIIGSFFYLLLSYLSNPRPTPEEPFPRPYRTQAERTAQLRSTVKGVRVKKWIWPLGFVKWRPGKEGGEGEAFLWWMRVWVGQYVIIRPLTTLAAVVSHYFDYYCLVSWSPEFVHVWSSATITISVTVAMYAVLQLYVVLKKELEPYSPILKFLAVKLVVFFTFWQESALSLLVTIGVIKSRTYWTAEDIVIGIAGLLSCFERMLFAFMHVKAFSYLPYRALASPILLDSTPLLGEKSEDDPPPAPGKHLTFAEWSAWDKQVKEREKDRLRLAKPKLPKRSGDLPPTKPDGNPILQQTKKWPAFVKCLRITDLAREIAEETRFVARGGKVEMTEDLLEEGRKDDYEVVNGAARPQFRQAETDERGEKGLDEELRSLMREGGQRVSLEGTRIDENGQRVSKKARGRGKHAWSNEEDRRTEEGMSLLGDGEEISNVQGWTQPSTSYPHRPQTSRAFTGSASFQQSPRLDSLRTTSDRPPSFFRPLSFPPRLSYTPDNIPFMASDSTIPFPAPHRLHSSTLLFSDPAASNTPPQRRPFPSSHVTKEEEHTRDITTETSSSKDSFGHLPQLQVRPSSFVPPGQMISPSPPPFSHWTTSNTTPKESTTTARPVHRSSTSLPINSLSPLDSLYVPAALTAPAAAFLGPGRSTPRFLPPGAAPSHILPIP